MCEREELGNMDGYGFTVTLRAELPQTGTHVKGRVGGDSGQPPCGIMGRVWDRVLLRTRSISSFLTLDKEAIGPLCLQL